MTQAPNPYDTKVSPGRQDITQREGFIVLVTDQRTGAFCEGFASTRFEAEGIGRGMEMQLDEQHRLDAERGQA